MNMINEATNNTAAAILEEAFIGYPLMDYIFPNLQEHQTLTTMWTRVAEIANESGNVLISEDQTGALCWIPRSAFRAIFNWKILSIPFIIGITATWRLFRHDDEIESFIDENAGDNMGYLWVIGVTPAGRGKGNCRTLVQKCVDEMKQHGITECWLKTEKEENVAIYTKIGFHVELEHVAKSSGLKCWALKMDI